MDTEQEIWRLAGEAIATQSLIIGLCDALVRTGNEAIVRSAFDYADAVADTGALKLAETQPEAHLTAIVNTLSQLRKAALGNDGGPKAAV